MTEDKVYLKHIEDTLSNIEGFVKGLTEEEFLKDIKTQYAVLRGIEVIGEATKNLSAGLKTKYKQIQWKKIAGMRDRLIHSYFGVDLELVWDVTHEDLPELKKVILEILKEK